MPASITPPPAISRYAQVANVALIILAVGVAFTIRAPKTGLAPTGTNRTLLLQNGSGATVGGCYDKGNCSFSGSITAQGVLINTGAVVTQSNADARYVNTSGDTMTGALKVRANLSGSTLNVDGTTRTTSGIIITMPKDIGWNVVTGANTACNTTCTSACVFGEDTSVLGSFVSCSDATADRCLCAGSN